jgi:hypothetical protein
MDNPHCASALFTALLISFIPAKCAQTGRPIPPGQREADRQTNAPIDEPSSKPRQQPLDPVKLKQEADELAKLSAGIPPQIELVTRGQLPKELNDQLKRIETLAKHLRGEVSP